MMASVAIPQHGKPKKKNPHSFDSSKSSHWGQMGIGLSIFTPRVFKDLVWDLNILVSRERKPAARERQSKAEEKKGSAKESEQERSFRALWLWNAWMHPPLTLHKHPACALVFLLPLSLLILFFLSQKTSLL
jgi:hypothetical protein